MATIEEIAKRARVSKTTVSFVINGRPGISPRTVARVRRVMAELNYVPSILARRFASRSSMTVALVAPEKPRVFCQAQHAEILDGVYETLESAGYSLLLVTTRRRGGQEPRHLQMVRSGQVDGLLLLEPDDTAELKELGQVAAPAVAVGWDATAWGIISVNADASAIGRLAAEYLVSLGHRRLGMVGEATPASFAYLAGLRAYLQQQGLPLPESQVFLSTELHGTACGRDGCISLLNATPRPTAIFCTDDTIALGVMRSAAERGLRVPQSLSLLGLGDDPLCVCCRPELSTLCPPGYELGKLAAGLLLERLCPPAAEPSAAERSHAESSASAVRQPVAVLGHHLAPTLIARQSCCPPAMQ